MPTAMVMVLVFLVVRLVAMAHAPGTNEWFPGNKYKILIIIDMRSESPAGLPEKVRDAVGTKDKTKTSYPPSKGSG